MASVSFSDVAGATSSMTSTVVISFSDHAAATDGIKRPALPGNRCLPAIVFMATAYQGST